MRKLASIERIWKIEPIEGADKIELVHVLGWQCVANKGQFQTGDVAVYFEIDSFLPVRSEFEFLRDTCYKKSDLLGEGFRLRTMRFRGQISQGLVLPLHVFPGLAIPDTAIGMSVADILGVRKWEIEERASTGGTIIGPLPPSVPKTDETRIQANPDLLKEFAGELYYISTKMDGSSHSVCIDADGFHVCGHNYEYRNDGSSSFYNYINTLDLEQMMRDYMTVNKMQSLVIQGEFCAPGIQKNRLKLRTPKWYVFTLIVDGKRAGLPLMRTICSELNLETVPIEETDRDLQVHYPTVESLLVRADGQYPNGGPKEGVVIRPVFTKYSPQIGGPLSIKVINNKYLLKAD